MFSRTCLSRVAEGRKNGLAFVPIGKLIGVVAAARLARLPRGDQQDRMVPIARVCHKAHGRPMGLRRRSDAINGSRVRFVFPGTAREGVRSPLAVPHAERKPPENLPPRCHSNPSSPRSIFERGHPWASLFLPLRSVDLQRTHAESCTYRSALSACPRGADHAGRATSRKYARFGRALPIGRSDRVCNSVPRRAHWP